MKCVLCSYLGKWPFITVGLRILIFFPSSEDAALTAEPMLPPSTQTVPLPPLLLALDHIARGTVCAQMDRPSCASQLCLDSANGSHAHLQPKTVHSTGVALLLDNGFRGEAVPSLKGRLRLLEKTNSGHLEFSWVQLVERGKLRVDSAC